MKYALTSLDSSVLVGQMVSVAQKLDCDGLVQADYRTDPCVPVAMLQLAIRDFNDACVNPPAMSSVAWPRDIRAEHGGGHRVSFVPAEAAKLHAEQLRKMEARRKELGIRD